MLRQRRSFLVQTRIGLGLFTPWPAAALSAPASVIANVTGLYPEQVARAVAPMPPAQLVHELRRWRSPGAPSR